MIYVQSQFFDLQKSTNGGSTFVARRRGISASESFLFIAPFTVLIPPNDQYKLAQMLVPQPGKPLHYAVKYNPGIFYMPYWQVDTQPFNCLPGVPTASS